MFGKGEPKQKRNWANGEEDYFLFNGIQIPGNRMKLALKEHVRRPREKQQLILCHRAILSKCELSHCQSTALLKKKKKKRVTGWDEIEDCFHYPLQNIIRRLQGQDFIVKTERH